MDYLPSQGTVATLVALATFSALMTASAVRDVTSFTIPNRLILWLSAGYALLAPLAGFGPREILVALGVASMVFFCSIAGFALGWMGGGDSKLLTVSALWIGPQAVPQFLLLTTLLGGLVALMLMTLRFLPDGPSAARPDWFLRLRAQESGVPYALPIGLAALMTLPQTPWLAGF